ncbi:MAG: acyltransferase [bacterium]
MGRRAGLKKRWARFWMNFAGTSPAGRWAMGIAAWGYPPYKGCHSLAKLTPAGYIARSAVLHHPGLVIGKRVFIGDDVTIYDKSGAGVFKIGNEVSISRGVIMEGGANGELTIGDGTTIQPDCIFAAYKGQIKLGRDVQVAPHCGFYPYNHGMEVDTPMKDQPLYTRGGIEIEDDVWLGFGVVVLDNVKIGQGSIIGAGSVVTRDIPAGVVAAGSPARVIKERVSCG